jgi:hypothetical protein
LIISLNTSHPATKQLAQLSEALRTAQRKEKIDIPSGFGQAVILSETNHGYNSSTYSISPGKATTQDAIEAYQHIRKFYPAVLDVFCHAVTQNGINITVEVGPAQTSDKLSYSYHDLLHIMPRVLALFRGTVKAE